MLIPILAFQKHLLIMPSHFIPSCPREAEAGVLRKLGLEIASKTNPAKSYSIPRGVVCLATLARTNREGSMKPAIMLVDVASANREGLKSFLQTQKCDVETAADGESAVKYCLQMQPDLVLLYDSLPDIGSFKVCR